MYLNLNLPLTLINMILKTQIKTFYHPPASNRPDILTDSTLLPSSCLVTLVLNHQVSDTEGPFTSLFNHATWQAGE